MMARQQLEGAQNVVYQYISFVSLHTIFGIVYHGKGTTLLQSCSSKLVSIERFALESEENATRRTVAAVGGNHRVAFKNLI